jgi:allantoinase
VLRWRGGLPVAVAVVILLEHVGDAAPASVPGASSLRIPPNLLLRSHREYGHRVGIFRLLAALQEYAVPASVAVDVGAASRYPFVIECCAEQGAEFLAHGLQVDQPLSSTMSADDEVAYLRTARDQVADLTGAPVAGWYGPEQSESAHTPMLLDRLGFRYVCDWPNDEQPYLMNTPGRLVSVPTNLPLDDVTCLWGHATAPTAYTNAVTASFDVLAADGARNARSMVLVVRPWLSGRAFQIDAFEAAIRHIASSGEAWLATAGEIAEAARSQLTVR